MRRRWQGFDAVFKVRKRLPYRHPSLDDSIRRQRTLHEAEMLHSAREAGVLTPHIFFVDPKGATIVMEYVAGERLKELVSRVSRREGERLFSALGTNVGKLHGSGIMHGDLTTANVLKRGSDLVFLDFGLALHSMRIEDHAVDLRLIKETVAGAHPEVAPFAMESLLRGYSAEAGASRSSAVQRQLRSIERRGRYARVD